VLTGDVSARDSLEPQDFAAAAVDFSRQLRQIAWLVGGKLTTLLVGIALAGLGLIIWGARGALGAGIAALVATFGLAWRVRTDFFEQVRHKGGDELWDAEIEWAIAYRFTILRNLPEMGKLKPRSRALPTIDNPTKQHLLTYKRLKTNRPRSRRSKTGVL
jgi:hypothetical protein